MPHFLINSSDISEGLISVLNPETVHHLVSALRIKKGETVKFIDENGVQHRAEIIDLSKKEVTAKILKSEKSTRVLNCGLYLAQAVLKPDAQSLLIANAAELGIKGVYPFVSEYSTVKNSVAKLKAEKWQKAADEAFKQCERADRMRVFEVLSLEEITKKFKPENVIVFAEKFAETDVFEAVFGLCKNAGNKDNEILVVTGPEGGFSDNEFEFFKKSGFKLVTLGNLIFRAPNAVTAGVSNIIAALNLKNKEASR